MPPNLLKRFRQRFGISAPRMTVQTHVAWYWRLLGLVAVLSCSFAVAAWIYDAGRRFAGFDSGEARQAVSQLRDHVARLTRESAALRASVDASESKLQIERAVQAQLGKQVKTLEDENARLKEDLAFFDNLIPSARQDNGLLINRFSVDPGALPGEFRYRLLLLQGGRSAQPFQGSLQLLVTLQQNGKSVKMVLPSVGLPEANSYLLNFKYFRRVEGTFKIPAGAQIKSVEVRLLQNGRIKASKTVAM